MKRVLRLLGMTVAALALVAVVAALVVYAWSESMLRRHSPMRAAPVTVPTDAASIAEGRRLSLVHGCVGCHGAGVAGNELLDEPAIATIVAPNLTQGRPRLRDPASRIDRKEVRLGVHCAPGTSFNEVAGAAPSAALLASSQRSCHVQS